MDFFDVIRNRGSYRGEFKKGSVPQEDLDLILEAGVRAPSGLNMQTTTFYAVTDEELREKISEVFPTKAVETAPVILVLTSKLVYAGESQMQFEIEDYSAATENMLLAITALGYAGVWMDGMMRFEGNVDKMRQILSIPEDENIRTIVPFGKPVDPVTQKEKKPVEERAHIL